MASGQKAFRNFDIGNIFKVSKHLMEPVTTDKDVKILSE
jgi:hypothetical protein